MGVIYRDDLLPDVHPTKWVHHFGLFAAVGAAVAALATVLVFPSVLGGRATGWRSSPRCCSCSP